MQQEVKEIVDILYSLADPTIIKKRERQFGILNTNGLGITHTNLIPIVKAIGLNSEIAIGLYETNIYEAKLLTSKIFPPKELTKELAIKWAKDFNNWEICDSFCQLFAKSTLGKEIPFEWAQANGEFHKRAAFATISSLCSADKKSENELFLSYLPLIDNALDDERMYVKKGVSWAARSIGKRNIDLKNVVINLFKNNKTKTYSKSASWITHDVLNELYSANCRTSDYPRSIYRN